MELAGRFQHQRTEGRRECQRIDAGNGNGRRQRQRELPVEDADRPFHETYRQKYGRHDQCDGDDGPADFLDGHYRGFIGREPLFVYLHMDRLDHHDGIVYHNTDRQDQREQGQHVDGESQRFHEEKGTDERDRHGDGRNQRGTEILQEDEHHDEHQDERFEQGAQYGGDGGVEKAGHVV